MKNIKSLLIAFLILTVCGFSASAGSIGVQVIQNDVAQGSVSSSSYLVENTILDSFFDFGYIVTNSPIALVKANNAASIENKALEEALGGQIDTLIFITVTYNLNESTNPDALLLANFESVSWKVVDVMNRNELGSGEIKVSGVTASNNSSNGIKKLVQTLAADVLDIIRSAR